MKRADVLSKLGNLSARWGSLLSGNREHLEELFVEIAKSLGVEVEPDEPELPERLSMRNEGPCRWCLDDDTEQGPTAGLTGVWIACTQEHYLRGRQLADALVAAYNNTHSQGEGWRAGAPPDAGEYLVRGANGAISVARCVLYPGNDICNPSLGWVTGPITGWMPLPKP